MSVIAKPVPVPDDLSAAFWSACERHELVMQQCRNCGWYAYPPGLVCTSCRVDPPDFDWRQVTGEGRLKTWTVIRDSFLPGFGDDVPFVVAEVELSEQPGLNMVARLDGIAIDDLRLGLAVQVAFGDIGGGAIVPYFVPTSS